MKSGTENLLKFKHLMRDLNLPEYATIGLLQTLWTKAHINCPRGNIGKFSNEDIAVILDWRGDADEMVTALVNRGWLDEHPEHRLIIHDWAEHCENTTHSKLARALEFFADGSSPKLKNLGERKDEITAFYKREAQKHIDIRTHEQNIDSRSDDSSKYREMEAPTVSDTVSGALANTVSVAAPEERTNGAHMRRERDGGGNPQPVGEILRRGDPQRAQPQPPPNGKRPINAERILAVTGEPQQAGDYWRAVNERLRECGKTGVLREGLEHLESPNCKARAPAKWLNAKCSKALKHYGIAMPPPWKQTA